MKQSLFFQLTCGVACVVAVAAGQSSSYTNISASTVGTVDLNSQDYYLGYHGDDYDTAWAKYYNQTDPFFSQNFTTGLERSPVAAALGLNFSVAPRLLDQPGYLQMENGYTVSSDGTLFVATQVEVSEDFTGEKFDFWFSWHVNDTRKYKLWNPNAHQYATLKSLSHIKASLPSYRERYWNLTSFVDEYIGDAARMLSIGFFDPSLLGFSLSTCDSGVETVVMAVLDIGKFEELDPAVRARTGLNSSLAYLLHQVRKRPDGKGNEIRSRFWFGKTFLDNIGLGGAASLQFGHDMAVHCFTEMTHLGSYLPALFNEFKNDIIVL